MARCGITTRTKVRKARPATRLSRTLEILRLEDHQTHPFPLQRFFSGRCPRGAVESLEAVIDMLPHALQLLSGNTEHS